MSDFQNAYVKGKTLEELVDALYTTAQPGSVTHEVIKAALYVRLAERLATPRRWAMIAIIAAVVSALGAVGSAVIAATNDPTVTLVQPTATATATATP
jgi:hypothetical protein